MATQQSQPLNQLESTLETYFLKKAPRLPKDIRELIVNFGPWVLLVMLILSLPGLLAAFGIGAIVSPYSFFAGSRYTVGFGISWILLAAILILEAIALPGLFKRKKQSWRYIYYAALIGAIQSIVMFNVLGFIVGTGLSMYILFQIKEHYK